MAPRSECWVWGFRFGILFIFLGAFLFLLGFGTTRWYDDSTVHYGLWERCEGASCDTFDPWDVGAFFVATQVLQCCAIGIFGFAPVLHFLLYVTKKSRDTGCRTRIFDVGYTIGNLCHASSVLIYGFLHDTPEHFAWSYQISAAASGITFLGLLISSWCRTKALKNFSFKNKRARASTVGVVIINNNTNISHANSAHPSPRVQQRDFTSKPGVDSGYLSRPPAGQQTFSNSPSGSFTKHPVGPYPQGTPPYPLQPQGAMAYPPPQAQRFMGPSPTQTIAPYPPPPNQGGYDPPPSAPPSYDDSEAIHKS